MIRWYELPRRWLGNCLLCRAVSWWVGTRSTHPMMVWLWLHCD